MDLGVHNPLPPPSAPAGELRVVGMLPLQSLRTQISTSPPCRILHGGAGGALCLLPGRGAGSAL